MKDLSNYSEEELEEALRLKRTAIKHANLISIFKNKYPSPVGWWEVTTEGDCEGRTTKKLGVYCGHVLDIAAGLQHLALYELRFTIIEKPQNLKFVLPLRTCVSVSLGIDSKTWDIKGQDREAVIKDWLRYEPAQETYLNDIIGTSYAGVKLEIHKKK